MQWFPTVGFSSLVHVGECVMLPFSHISCLGTELHISDAPGLKMCGMHPQGLQSSVSLADMGIASTKVLRSSDIDACSFDSRFPLKSLPNPGPPSVSPGLCLIRGWVYEKRCCLLKGLMNNDVPLLKRSSEAQKLPGFRTSRHHLAALGRQRGPRPARRLGVRMIWCVHGACHGATAPQQMDFKIKPST